MAKKQSERAIRRAKLIRAGKCGTCGKRKLAKNRDGKKLKECRPCLTYYAGKAREYAKAAKKRK